MNESPTPPVNVPATSATQENTSIHPKPPWNEARNRTAMVTPPASRMDRSRPQRIPAASATKRYTNQNAATDFVSSRKTQSAARSTSSGTCQSPSRTTCSTARSASAAPR